MIRRLTGRICDEIAFAFVRRHYRRKNVFISHQSTLVGETGISFQSGTQIHPYATVSCGSLSIQERIGSCPMGSISVGKNCWIMRNAMLVTYAGTIEIGDDVSINPGTIIYGNGGVKIGNATRIATGTVIVAANHIFDDRSTPIMKQGLTMKGITIGDDVWIGSRVVIVDGANVGHGCVIGAGSVVTKSLPDYSVAVGSPARVIKTR